MTKFDEICGGGAAERDLETLSVLVANVYQGNRRIEEDLDLMESLDLDVVGVSEGHRLPVVKPWGFRRVQTRRGGQYSREVPVLVRRGRLDVEGSRFVKGAPGVRDYERPRHRWTKVGKPRWITVVRLTTKDGRRVSIVNTHMHAAIVDKSGRPYFGSKRVAQYVEHMKRLLEVVREERANGWEPVVTGDLNFPRRGDDSWEWSPESALGRVGLKWRAPNLDGVAFDPDVFRVDEFERVDSIGSDHPYYVLARLRWRT